MSAVETLAPAAPADAYAAEAAATAGGLYERHAPHVFRYCRRLLDSREEAEDAVQTTFVQAFSALRRGAVPESERAWLLSIARNVCNDHWRRSSRRRASESGHDPSYLEDVLVATEPDRDQLMPLRPALAALTEQQRRAILLREWQGLSYHEIADDLGLSQSAVEALIFRARRALAQGLESQTERVRRVGARALDAGSLLGALKSALAGGGLAAKAAVATAVVAAVVAGPALVERDGERAAPRPDARTPAGFTPTSAVADHAVERLAAKHAGAAATATDAKAERSKPTEKPSGKDDRTDAPPPSTDEDPGTGSTTGDEGAVTTVTDTTTGAVDTVVETTEDAVTDVTGALDDTVATTEDTVAGVTNTVDDAVEPILGTPLPSVDLDTSLLE